MVVAKFGGTSMGTAEAVQKVANIIGGKTEDICVIVSAPYGITNQLIKHTNDPYIISRGEYFSAKVLSAKLNFNFVDAKDIIVIKKNKRVNLRATKTNIAKYKLNDKLPFVMGGFYGQDNHGGIALLSRGGSDYTGAVMAVLMGAKLYENWTDVNGIFTADPKTNPDAKHIQYIDFDTLDYMTHHGAKIIHENVAELLKKYRLPLKIDNTFDPNRLWTEVHSKDCHNIGLGVNRA
jgi:homoserine O-succinyltransferase